MVTAPIAVAQIECARRKEKNGPSPRQRVGGRNGDWSLGGGAHGKSRRAALGFGEEDVCVVPVFSTLTGWLLFRKADLLQRLGGEREPVRIVDADSLFRAGPASGTRSAEFAGSQAYPRLQENPHG